jgi:GGDEF domain-containing protein
MNTAGDEFVLLLAGQDNEAVETRRRNVEHALDHLEVHAKFDHIYRGASVGAATRQPKKTAGQTLGRAVTAMRTRKRERQAARSGLQGGERSRKDDAWYDEQVKDLREKGNLYVSDDW